MDGGVSEVRLDGCEPEGIDRLRRSIDPADDTSCTHVAPSVVMLTVPSVQIRFRKARRR